MATVTAQYGTFGPVGAAATITYDYSDLNGNVSAITVVNQSALALTVRLIGSDGITIKAQRTWAPGETTTQAIQGGAGVGRIAGTRGPRISEVVVILHGN
jgi:hypothetical protein